MCTCELFIHLFAVLWMFDGVVDSVKISKPIDKSLRDPRSYRGLTFDNEMKVVLISDQDTETSAVSMVVGIGGLNDPSIEENKPRLLEGMVNLIGHVLWKASDEYPDEGAFRKFLHEHDGNTHPIFPLSEPDKQAFTFDVDSKSENFSEALKMFAHVFLTPKVRNTGMNMLKEGAMEIGAEFARRKFQDIWRVAQVEKAISKKDHPYNHIFTGTKETLLLATLPNVQREFRDMEFKRRVREFYEKSYSSNIMCLAVLGKESLDELQAMVVPLFSQVENKKVQKLKFSFDEHPWGKEQLGYMIKVVATEEKQLLRINFPVPAVSDEYNTAPELYVLNLINYREPQGLSSTLNDEGLCLSLNAEYSSQAGIAFFRIICELTDEGLNRVDDIIDLIFEYLHLLKSEGVDDMFFYNMKEVDKIFFSYKETNLPEHSYVESIASALHDYPLEDVLSHKYMHANYRPELIHKFLDHLIPSRMNITIVSKSFEGKTSETEPDYWTFYSKEEIPAGWIKRCEEKDPTIRFLLPKSNEFIPSDFEVFPMVSDAPSLPIMIQPQDSTISQIWFKQDSQVNLPKVHVHFQIFCSTSNSNPSINALMDTYVDILDTYLAKELYSAHLVGYIWKLIFKDNRISMMLHGFHDKIPLLLEKIMTKIVNFKDEIDEKLFEEGKEKYMKLLNEFKKEELVDQAYWYVNYLLGQSSWTGDNLISVTKRLQLDGLKRTLTDLFSRVFIQGLIYGNYTFENANSLIKIIEKPFEQATGLYPEEISRRRVIKLDEGANLTYNLFTKFETPNEPLFLYFAYFQLTTSKDELMAGLLMQMFHEDCERMLYPKYRDVEANCGLMSLNGIPGFIVVVESEEVPRYMDSKAERLLLDILEKLREMSTFDFLSHKTVFLGRETYSNPDTLTQNFGRYLSQITNQTYNFEKTESDVDELHEVELDDLIAFVEEKLVKTSTRRRKLAVYVFPKVFVPAYADDIPRAVTKIENAVAFKHNSFLHPLPIPHLAIPPLGNNSEF